MSFADHFSQISAAYAAFRPRYPDALFAYLAREAPARESVWDAGTGSGQAAVGLARHFTRVIATDPSPQQIEQAEPTENVEYRVASAEASGLAAQSMDLVTAAQALHWFDPPRFWAEARRVLRAGGVIAVWTYDLLEIAPAIDAQIQRFYRDVVGPFWPPERRMVEQRYRNIEFPFDEFTAPGFAIERHMTLDDVSGYIRTWSATRAYVEHHGRDPVEPLHTELARVWEPQEPRLVRWPIAMRVGRV